MSRPTAPHPVNPARPRPLPAPRPTPQPRPARLLTAAAGLLIVAGGVLIALPIAHPHHPATPPAWVPPHGYVVTSVPARPAHRLLSA